MSQGEDQLDGIEAINCTFTQNNAQYGGAISGGFAENCTFTQNTANRGGAIYGGTANNCTFTENTATEGGAISGSDANNCNFTQNSVDFETDSEFDIDYYSGGAINNGELALKYILNNNGN